MEDVFVFGLSDYSKLVAGYFGASPIHNFKGYIVDSKVDLKPTEDQLILNYSEFKEYSRPCLTTIFSTVGYSNMRNRSNVLSRLSSDGYQFTSLICDNTFVGSNVQIGKNCIVMPGTVIEDNVKIGTNNTIWSNVTVCHDSMIGDHNFFAANTVIGGRSTIGSGCFFGFSSTILQKIIIESETLVGAASLVTRNTKAFGKYVGSPARLVSSHKENGIKIA